MAATIVIVVAIVVLAALGMVLRRDWQSVELDARVTKWIVFTLKLRKPSPRTGPGSTAEIGPGDPTPTRSSSSMRVRRAQDPTREPSHPPWRTVAREESAGDQRG